jgi:hypothetical protein
MDRGEKRQNRRMKGALFCVFLIIFVVIVAFTIAKVFFDFGNPTTQERATLFKVFITEVGVAVLAVFMKLFNLKRQPKEKTPIPKVCGKYKYELTCGDNKTMFMGECRIKQDGHLLDIHGERKKARFGRKKENVSIRWYSQWAELCRDNKVRLDYFITQNGGIRGYAVLDIGRVTPKAMVGEFHFLNEPYVYGTIKLRRA